nr:hypothetical protein [Salmonid herpesvirus 1]UNP64433.1 hypothetical protein [Salmonid herpesvirus 1]
MEGYLIVLLTCSCFMPSEAWKLDVYEERRFHWSKVHTVAAEPQCGIQERVFKSDSDVYSMVCNSADREIIFAGLSTHTPLTPETLKMSGIKHIELTHGWYRVEIPYGTYIIKCIEGQPPRGVRVRRLGDKLHDNIMKITGGDFNSDRTKASRLCGRYGGTVDYFNSNSLQRDVPRMACYPLGCSGDSCPTITMKSECVGDGLRVFDSRVCASIQRGSVHTDEDSWKIICSWDRVDQGTPRPTPKGTVLDLLFTD